MAARASLTPNVVKSLAHQAVKDGGAKRISEFVAYAYCPLDGCRTRIEAEASHPTREKNPARARDIAVERKIAWHLTHECQAR